ncbi:hypothetical protein [Salinigranum sp. GCM10025319]|uniref:hypothetical protein n=1 Tax=Salinigranum sp. GCM10025319 TaxID=3252687 RepID=UPI00360A9EA9
MVRMRGRRELLVSAGVLFSAGCVGTGDPTDDSGSESSSGSSYGDESVSRSTPTPTPVPDADYDGVPDRRDEYPNDSERSRLLDEMDRLVKVQEDEHRGWTLDLPESAFIEYEAIVRDGPSVDIIVFPSDEYSHYQSGNRASYYSAVSRLDTNFAQVKGALSAGEYAIVIDNTRWGEAYPPTNFDDDIADVEIQIEISA